jgi:DNA-binding PadR family transcriptional regulator
VPIHHAVLGLLAEGPSYGYELKNSFEEALGPGWGDLNIGHVYQVLDRLTRDRLVTKRLLPQIDRPDRHVYRQTPEGREELREWLAEPSVRQSGYRDDSFLKLFVASRRGGSALREVLRIQRESYLRELATLMKLRKARAAEPLVQLLIDAAVLHTKAGLRITESPEDKIDLLVSTAQGPPVRSGGRDGFEEQDPQDVSSAS